VSTWCFLSLLLTSTGTFAFAGGVESILYSFPLNDNPSPLIQASDGNFYGTVGNNGANGEGYVFSLTPSGTISVIYNFTGAADGGVPQASLIEGNDGNLYGTNTIGGLGSGVLFRLTLGGAITVLHNFVASTDGSAPGALIEDSAGNFFGAAYSGGAGSGTIFEYSQAGAFSVVHTFTGTAGDGAEPNAPLLQASDGFIYGVTVFGGSTAIDMFGDQEYMGTVFSFNPSVPGSFSTIASFPSTILQPYSAIAFYPAFGLTEGPDGALYGLTGLGGQIQAGQYGAAGTMYRVTLGSAPSLILGVHYFLPLTDGNEPRSGLTLGGDGNFYGTTSMSGPETAQSPGVKYGTVFQSDTNGNVNVIYSFANPPGGPFGSPLEGADGNFYGRVTGASVEIYKLIPGLQVPAPVALTASASTITLGQSTTLSWKVSNAFSQTAANCYAHGAWSGSRPPTGSQFVTPAATGTYNYALTCGGVESGSTTVIVNAPVTGPTATPVITPGGGIFGGSQAVSITDATPGAIIYYTTDGSTPTSNSMVWGNPSISIRQTQTINAIAIASPLKASAVASATFSRYPETCNILYNQGFYQHGGLTLNNGASVSNTTLMLTHQNLNEYTSAFTNQAIPVNYFASEFQFRFKNAAAGPAGGLAFVIQANSPNALGSGAGGNLGYTGMANSMALKFDLFNTVGGVQNSVGLFFGGAYPGSPAVDLTPSGINLRNGHTLDAHVSLSGSYLTLNLKDIDTQATFNYNFPLPATNPFGANAAFAGFTASSGASSSSWVQLIAWTLQDAGSCAQQ
jgi:uncharacterized repeat protein (TIGR03803 family)